MLLHHGGIVSKRFPTLSVHLRRRSPIITRRSLSKKTNESSSQKNQSWRGLVIGVATGVVLVGGAMTARVWYDQILRGNAPFSERGVPRRDGSSATVLLKQAPSPIARTSAKLTQKLQTVNSEELHGFLVKQQALLQQAKAKSRQVAKATFDEELKEALEDCSRRVTPFADWYFAYPTNWKLLSLALSSAAKHAVTIRKEQSLNQRVSQDLQEHVRRKYEAIVLRPAQTDPKIQRALVHSLQVAHDHYLNALSKVESSLGEFLDEQSKLHNAYETSPMHNDVVVDMDWIAQLQKVEHVPIAYEKSPTVALIGAGVIVGKLAGGATTKALLSKLAAPFATKAVGVTLSGGAAASAGALVAGPVGAVVGAAVGLGVDMTVNAGVALLQRSGFETEVQDSLQAMRLEWEERLLPELGRVQDVWFDHAESVLSDASKTNDSKRK